MRYLLCNSVCCVLTENASIRSLGFRRNSTLMPIHSGRFGYLGMFHVSFPVQFTITLTLFNVNGVVFILKFSVLRLCQHLVHLFAGRFDSSLICTTNDLYSYGYLAICIWLPYVQSLPVEVKIPLKMHAYIRRDSSEISSYRTWYLHNYPRKFNRKNV